MGPDRGLALRLSIWAGAACLLYALLGLAFGWREFSRGLLAVPAWTYAPLAGFAAANYLLRFLRWRIYLRRVGAVLPAGRSAAIYFASYAMVVTPVKLGEIYKAVLLRENHGVPLGRGLAVIVAERIYDFLGVLLLAAAGAVAWKGPPSGPWLDSAAAVAVLAGIGALASGRLQRMTVERLMRTPYLRGRGVGLREAANDLRNLTSGGVAVWSLALSVAAWICECASLWFLCRVLSMPVDLLPAMFIYAGATLAGAAAFLPGGLGGTEAVLIALLRSSAVPLGTAVSISVVVRLMTLWFAVAIGVAVFAAARRALAPPGTGSVLQPVDDQNH